MLCVLYKMIGIQLFVGCRFYQFREIVKSAEIFCENPVCRFAGSVPLSMSRNLLIASQTRSQLRHIPIFFICYHPAAMIIIT